MMDKIEFENKIYYKINNEWFEVIEREETYFSGSKYITVKVPNIIGDKINIKNIIRLKKIKNIIKNDKNDSTFSGYTYKK